MMYLVKCITSDAIATMGKWRSYLFFNFKKVRITLECRISTSAQISPYCTFTGNSLITDNAIIAGHTYGHDVNINNATLGSYCSLAPGVKIGLDEHPIDEPSTHPHFYDKIVQKRSVIGNHVWIGANAVVLTGVTIGDHSIIAAGSVITKDVDSYSIVAGVPAKLIKQMDRKLKI